MSSALGDSFSRLISSKDFCANPGIQRPLQIISSHSPWKYPTHPSSITRPDWFQPSRALLTVLTIKLSLLLVRDLTIAVAGCSSSDAAKCLVQLVLQNVEK